jgi:hypothetical protein
VIWLFAKHSPTLGDRALFILPCLAVGLAALGFIAELARKGGHPPVEIMAYIFYIVGLMGQSLAFERYTEVMTFITLSVAAARVRIWWHPGLGFLFIVYAFELFAVFNRFGS